MADTILCIGIKDEKLFKLLDRLGYKAVTVDAAVNFSDLPLTEVVDLVLFETGRELPAEDVITLLRAEPLTKFSAIVMLSTDTEELAELQQRALEGVELFAAPYSLGMLASRIATQLRMRKMKGQDEISSSLSEMNAALRDLNARYAKDLEEARQIQASLLPQEFPMDERFELGVYYKPLEEVGGDWYNMRVEISGKISAQVADVSGHGLAAAFLGSMAKLGFSAVSEELPDLLFQGMNELLTPQMPAGRFVTMCGFLFDPQSGQVLFARAGHQPALVLNVRMRSTFELKGEGFAMGFFEEASYTREEAVLGPGDALIIFSDGLVEAQNRDQKTYGLDGLSKSLCKASTEASVQGIIDHIISDFELFMDGRVLKDDVTLLALKRKL